MLKRISWCLGLTVCLLAAQVQARTLFIDFNNAESEIAVFRQSQQGVASEVVVVPSYKRITPKQRLQVVKANEAIEKYTLLVQDCAVAVKKDQNKCDAYYDRIVLHEQEREKATGGYTAEDMKAELLALMEDKLSVPFNMVVISGHHELGFFRGELTDAKVKEFIDMMTDSRDLYNKVNTVVFLGCDTGTKEVFQNTLLSMFPGVPVILGSEDRAPTRNEARNLAYIKQVMTIRPKLLAAKSVKEVQPLFQSLLSKHWPASLLWKQNFVFLKESTETL
jgi:hypothetical protein